MNWRKWRKVAEVAVLFPIPVYNPRMVGLCFENRSEAVATAPQPAGDASCSSSFPWRAEASEGGSSSNWDLAWIFHSRIRTTWVAQATCLSRSATCRPERKQAVCFFQRQLLSGTCHDLPPGHWPGGTGESPVPPSRYEISGLEPV